MPNASGQKRIQPYETYLLTLANAINVTLLALLILFAPHFFLSLNQPDFETRQILGLACFLLGILLFQNVLTPHKVLIYRLSIASFLLIAPIFIFGYAQNSFYLPAVTSLALWLYYLLYPLLRNKHFPYLAWTAGISLLISGLIPVLQGQADSTAALLIASSLLYLLALADVKHAHTELLVLAWGIWYLNLWPGRIPFAPEILVPGIAVILTLCIDSHFNWTQFILQEKRPAYRHSQRLLFLSWAAAIPGILLLLRSNFFKASMVVPPANWASFTLLLFISLFFLYSIGSLNRFINRVASSSLTEPDLSLPGDSLESKPNVPFWARWLPPFEASITQLQRTISRQSDLINSLKQQVENQRQYINRLLRERDLQEQLSPPLDKLVAAQLAANTARRLTHSDLITIMVYAPEEKKLLTLAVSGEQPHSVPLGYTQTLDEGLAGRALRTHKTQVAQNVHMDTDYVPHSSLDAGAEIVIPIIHQGYINGVFIADKITPNSFTSDDISLLKATVRELLKAWERAEYNENRQALLEKSSSLSRKFHPQEVLDASTRLARDIMHARFAYGILFSQEKTSSYTARSGFAPKLAHSLSRADFIPIIQKAAMQGKTLHIRDISQKKWAKTLVLDGPRLKDLVICPIRIHEQTVGALLVFGKNDAVSFSSADLELLDLLGIQVSSAIESTWLYEELRTTLRTTNRLYQLSIDILQAQSLTHAANRIVETAYDITEAQSAGIIILDDAYRVLAQASINYDDSFPDPKVLLPQLDNLLIMSMPDGITRVYLPLKTTAKEHGLLWLVTSEDAWNRSRNSTALQTMMNHAAIALERILLVMRTQEQAQHLEKAYNLLEKTYDETLAALMSALDARDRETEGHSIRVSKLACELGRQLQLPPEKLKVLERGALLHDIGKIGISDTILHKPGPLTEQEWEIMRQHPDIGARIVQGIPFLEDTIDIIRFHQERWDGSGYPSGLKGKEIPLMARIFAVVDALDALTSNRPYRTKNTLREAIAYIQAQAGRLFDPEIVSLLSNLYQDGRLEAYLEIPDDQ